MYQRFRFAPAHSRYMHDAIKQRRAGDAAAPFWGFDLHERRPQVGDILTRQRPRLIDLRPRDAQRRVRSAERGSAHRGADDA